MQSTQIPDQETTINTQIDEFPVSLTPKAIEMVKMAIEEDAELSGHSLRVAVVGGGCSGYSYQLDFDENADPEDLVTEVDGLRVFVDPHTAEILVGTEIDYVSTLTRSGFVFNNPNANRTCGCGSSFA